MYFDPNKKVYSAAVIYSHSGCYLSSLSFSSGSSLKFTFSDDLNSALIFYDIDHAYMIADFLESVNSGDLCLTVSLEEFTSVPCVCDFP